MAGILIRWTTFGVLLTALALFFLATSFSRAAAVVNKDRVSRPDPGFLLHMARSGRTAAQSLLGEMYLKGEEVPQDFGEALKWLRAAASSGDADAQERLGFMYETGKGVERDPDMAAKWYGKAMRQGHVLAYYKLHFSYVGEINIP